MQNGLETHFSQYTFKNKKVVFSVGKPMIQRQTSTIYTCTGIRMKTSVPYNEKSIQHVLDNIPVVLGEMLIPDNN